jgi:hypothetical protein
VQRGRVPLYHGPTASDRHVGPRPTRIFHPLRPAAVRHQQIRTTGPSRIGPVSGLFHPIGGPDATTRPEDRRPEDTTDARARHGKGLTCAAPHAIEVAVLHRDQQGLALPSADDHHPQPEEAPHLPLGALDRHDQEAAHPVHRDHAAPPGHPPPDLDIGRTKELSLTNLHPQTSLSHDRARLHLCLGRTQSRQRTTTTR